MLLTGRRNRLLRLVAERSSNVFEPVVRIEDRSVFGYEALLRFPARSAISSATDLFARAGRLALTGRLDTLTARKAMVEFASTAPAPGTMLFYNLHNPAADTLRRRWPSRFRTQTPDAAALDSGDIPICIELSEQTPVDPESLERYVARWHPRPKLALDDFGTGHSGLARLVRLQPDFVKIDRLFIAGIVTDGRVEGRLARIVDLIHETGAQVIVEGVETEAALCACHRAGCGYAQGFLFGNPRQPAAGLGRS